jgi:hypothetical protein
LQKFKCSNKTKKLTYTQGKTKRRRNLPLHKCDLSFEFQQWINDGTCHWNLGVDMLFVVRASSVRS